MANYNSSYGPYNACTSLRRPSRPSNIQPAFDRSNFVDLRHDYPYRNYPLPSAMHDHGSDEGQNRKRSQVACARCRKRKIKCSGNPGDDSGCHACRSAGTAASLCKFERVGTQYRFGFDTIGASGNPTLMSPTSCFNDAGFLPSHAIDGESRTMSCVQGSYDRTSFPEISLIDYQYHLGHFDDRNAPLQSRVTDATFDNDRNWNDRPATSMGGMESSYQPSYRFPEVLAPLSIEALQGPPPPMERRLPAPNFVGTPMSSDSSTSPSSAMNRKLNGLSLCNGGRAGDTLSSGRQNSIQDLANASISLPGPSRQGYRPIAPSQRQADDAPVDYASFTCSSGSMYSAPNATSYLPALPPMHVPSPFDSYSQEPTSPVFANSMQSSFSNDNASYSNHKTGSSSDQGTEYVHEWTSANDTSHHQETTSTTREDIVEQRYVSLAPLLHAPTEANPGSPVGRCHGKVDSIMDDQSVKSRQGSQGSSSGAMQDN